MLAVLRQRNFALVWVAGLLSLTMDWLLFVAVPLVVYELTGSTVATAVAVATRVIPRLLLGSVAGVFVDRWDRRRTMIVANLLLGISLLPLLLVRSADWLWIIYAVNFTESVLAQFLAPAENALLPRLVAEHELVPANALNGLNNNLARLIGPVLGGLVVARWGLSGAALLDAASFVIAAGLVALVRIDARPLRAGDADERSEVGPFVAAWREWIAGLGLVRQVRSLAVLFLFIALTGLGEGALSTLFVPFVTTILGGDGQAYGAILAAQAVGGLLGYAAIGRVGQGISTRTLLGAGAIGLGAIDFLIFNAHRAYPGIVAPIALMIVVGLPGAGIGVGYTTLLQTAVADAYRGRVFGSFMTVQALTVLIGAGLAGTLSGQLGIVSLLNIQCAVYLLGGLLVLALLPVARERGAEQAVPET